MSDVYRELADYITASLGSAIQHSEVRLGELMLTVEPAQIVQVVTFLRDDKNCLFKLLLDVCGVDFPDRDLRFDVVYNLLSIKHNYRIRVKAAVAEDAAIPSVVGVFSTAGWFEREAYDMFGIFFDGNPDLRRILTDYGFEGHAFRKDFPLTGYVEVRYDEEQKRVVYEPVKLVQDYRNFEFLSPWEAMTDVQLPGDEKAVKPAYWDASRK
jgi:NADH-quinone oxidoreductase subunit C